MHGTPPLKWDNGLAASAQEWAYNRQRSGCVMTHSNWPQLGECVAAGTYRGLTGYNYWGSEDNVASGWYHEPFVYGSSTVQINHFTQLIWSNTTRLGCAWASCEASNAYEFWVCQFTPAGNRMDASVINANVPRPCRSSSQCLSVLRGVDLQKKFPDQAGITAALQPNVPNPSTYNYGANTCRTPFSAYVPNTAPICVTDSTVLPRTINVTVTNPTSTGPLNVMMNCPTGGSRAVTCTSTKTWNICGSPSAPAPTSPPASGSPSAPAPTSPPASGCWGSILVNQYLSAYPTGWSGRRLLSLNQAQTECLTLPSCGGVTETTTGWQCRAGRVPMLSGTGENSYIRSISCGASPTSPSIRGLADVTLSIDALFAPTLSAYVMSHRMKKFGIEVTPETLNDGPIPQGQITITDTYVSDATVPPVRTTTRLTVGKATVNVTWGGRRTGYHTILATYSGDAIFKASSATFSVLFFNGPSSGHFVIPSSVATVSNTVYFYGSDWSQVNNQTTAPRFLGLLNDTTLSPQCSNTVSGPNALADQTYNVGQYIGAYVVDTLNLQANTTYSGILQKVAIIKLPRNGQSTVNTDTANIGLGIVLDLFCPKPNSF